MDYSAAAHISPPNMPCFVLISFIVCKVENWKNVEGNLLKLGKKQSFPVRQIYKIFLCGMEKKALHEIQELQIQDTDGDGYQEGRTLGISDSRFLRD